jgi:hypothetical protein
MLRPGDLNKLIGTPWTDIRLLSLSFVLLGLARAAVLLIPFRWILRVLGMTPVDGPTSGTDVSSSTETSRIAGSDSPLAMNRAQVARIGWAIGAAASRTPWQSNCLVQALAGSVLLRGHKIPFTLHLGVAKDVVCGIKAHAWLSCGGVTATRSTQVEHFHTIFNFGFHR